MAWYSPVEMNDWGHRTVHAGKPSLSKAGTWNSKESDIPAIGKGSVRVKWPDGSEETLRVVMRSITEDVDDMGHSYSVTSSIPHIRFMRNGAWVTVPLTKAGCKVWRG